MIDPAAPTTRVWPRRGTVGGASGYARPVLMHAIALLAAASAHLQVPAEVDPAALRDADLVFHTSTSTQAQAIVWATASPYAHVGLIEHRGEQVYVLEAVQPVKRTAWPRGPVAGSADT